MERSIIKIDDEKCTGCGLCIPNCPEGAIQIIDGKARLVSDLMCDGLGACLGHCPEGAIEVERREAVPYDERKVMANVVTHGENTIRAHLKHLRDHNENEYYKEAVGYLKDNDIPIPDHEEKDMTGAAISGGCPGSKTMSFNKPTQAHAETTSSQPSQLGHWPVQMHLISPNAPHYRGSDLLLAADCTAFAAGNFHSEYLKGKTLAIACPKLDEGREIYIEKIRLLIDEAKINTLTVMIMQVPCCGGLLQIAKTAAEQAQRKVPVKAMVLDMQGRVLSEEWV